MRKHYILELMKIFKKCDIIVNKMGQMYQKVISLIPDICLKNLYTTAYLSRHLESICVNVYTPKLDWRWSQLFIAILPSSHYV